MLILNFIIIISTAIFHLSTFIDIVCSMLSTSVCSSNTENMHDGEAGFSIFPECLTIDTHVQFCIVSSLFLKSTFSCLSMRLLNDMLRFIKRLQIQLQITAFDIREGIQSSS